MRKIITVCLVLTLVLSTSLLVKAEVSQQTINYLLDLDQNAWATQGLAATGENSLDLSYLDNFNGNNASAYARSILAIVAAGENPYDFNGQNLVEGLLSYYDNGQFGSANLLNDDIWAILALRAADMSADEAEIMAAKNTLLASQNEDGGWGFSPAGSSDTNDTAAAIMALLDAGLNANSAEITEALAYLENLQNEDGGFGFSEGSDSDSGSDAWVVAALNKAGLNPETWEVEGNSPVDHLQTLALDDGSYKWVASDETGNSLMTAYAAVALAGSYYPVSYYDLSEPEPNEPGLYHLRIEGPEATICNAEVEAATVLEIIQNGAEVCGYEYVVEESEYGSYISSIDSVEAEGAAGWMYWVNWQAGMVGAADYELTSGDEVLWAYGEYGIQPLNISLSGATADLNEDVIVSVDYYNGSSWLAANQATVVVGEQNYQTDASGQATISLNQKGSYTIYAEKNNFIRSPQDNLVVGSEASQSVGLEVNINNPSNNGSSGQLSFSINISDISFGTLTPGDEAESSITLTNNGEVAVYLEGEISGDSLFADNVYLANDLWENYSGNINPAETETIKVRLAVPENYSGNGLKQGNLIFWGSKN